SSLALAAAHPPSLSLRRRPPPRPTLFPYTTLFRSVGAAQPQMPHALLRGGDRRFGGREADAVVVGPDLGGQGLGELLRTRTPRLDRKSTRLNSSHVSISYAVFCLKKKKKINYRSRR